MLTSAVFVQLFSFSNTVYTHLFSYLGQVCLASGDPLAGVQGASEMPVSSAQQCRAGTARLSAGAPELLGQPLGMHSGP